MLKLIDADELKEVLSSKDLITWTHEYGDAIPLDWLMSTIDNAPTVETQIEHFVDLEKIKTDCINCERMKQMDDYNNCMTIDKFYKYIANNRCEDYIVKLATRYTANHEKYYISYEVCCIDESGSVTWFNDWDEGQDDVKVIAWCPVDCAFNAWLERDDGFGT